MRSLGVVIAVAVFFSLTIPASADYFTMPWKQAPGPAPVSITQASLFSDVATLGNQVRACVSFKNTTQKPINTVEFTFRFDDMLGNPLAEGILQRTGSFGPGVIIEGKMNLLGGNTDSYNNCKNINGTSLPPVLETIGVSSVRFEDGTTWKKGDPLPGAGPAAAGGGQPGAPAGPTVVNGAAGQGGSFAPAGGFWTIAWIRGSRKLLATSVDESSQTSADYAALSKCNALNGGGSSCEVVVNTAGAPAGAQKKCGALVIDEPAGKYAWAWGPTQSDTIRVAQDSLVKLGGSIGPDSVVSVVCNTK